VEKTPAHHGAITALALSKDRTQWLSSGADLQIKSWPPAASRAATFKKTHTGPITSLAMSAAGNWAASASGDRTVRTWFMQTGAEIASFEGTPKASTPSPSRPTTSGSPPAATTRHQNLAHQGRQARSRPRAGHLEKHTKAVTCLAFTPGGKRLLSGSQDQS